mmetsp:Transcript_5976/g.8851  ORF Transcript_5976/g.8851 Transcript_5976/m.8851 type:complete len:116 (+) Transcript_5976:1043-1390(+)
MESLCRQCLEFYASRDGLCSQCFKELSLKEQGEKAISQVIQIVPQLPVQKDTKRCWFCQKKVGALSFRCKCNYFFCSAHRLPEEHQCTHNFKAEGIKQLQKDNPQVLAAKFNKID